MKLFLVKGIPLYVNNIPGNYLWPTKNNIFLYFVLHYNWILQFCFSLFRLWSYSRSSILIRSSTFSRLSSFSGESFIPRSNITFYFTFSRPFSFSRSIVFYFQRPSSSCFSRSIRWLRLSLLSRPSSFARKSLDYVPDLLYI